MRGDPRLELGERCTREHLDMPGLEVAAGWRSRRAVENVADGGQRNGGRQERPAGMPGRDGVAYVHREESPRLITRSVACARRSKQKRVSRDWISAPPL